MEPTKLSFYEELEADIRAAYEKAIDEDEAKRLAAKFLLAQLDAGRELANLDLDARMKKTGVKSYKAQVYLKHAQVPEGSGEKNPTDATLASLVDSDQTVMNEQDVFDKAEVQKNLVQVYLDTFRDAHIYFRALAKGRFE